MSENDTTTKKISGLDEALEDIKAGRVSGPMTIEEFNVYLDEVWEEAKNEI